MFPNWAVRILGGLATLFIGLPLMVMFLQAIAKIFITFLAWTAGLLYAAFIWLWRQVFPIPHSAEQLVFSESTPNSIAAIPSQDSNEAPPSQPTYFRDILLRLPQARCFAGVLDGRRLIRVFGIRHAGASYDEDYEADHFWLVLEGDEKHEQIWLSIQWVIDFFTKVPGLHVRECVVDAGSQLLL